LKNKSRRDKKVVVYLRGGLGNQLFQFFAAKDLAIRLGYRLIMDTSLLPSKQFTDERGVSVFPYALGQLNHHIAIQRTKIHRFAPERFAIFVLARLAQVDRKVGGLYPKFWAKLGRFSSDKFVDLKNVNHSAQNIILNSPFLDNQMNLDLIRDNIQELFKAKATSSWFRRSMEELIKVNPVSIHVRLGDHQRLEPNLDFDFYLRARKWIDESMPNSPVWIFSDEPGKARELLGDSYSDALFVESDEYSNPIESLILMSSGQALICGRSTYSLWAAQLASSRGGIVVGDMNWVNQADAPTYLDRFARGWILI
jgi:hypothetical protein